MPDRSVSVVVAERVEKARSDAFSAFEEAEHWGTSVATALDRALHAFKRALDVLAMVEALAQLADAEKAENADPLEWATWAHELARAVLGGEVRGRSDTSDATAEALEHIWAAREALRRGAAGSRLSAYVQSFVDEAHGSLAAAETALAASTSNDRGDE